MTDQKSIIKWSPSVDRRYYRISWQFEKMDLFPPFLQTVDLVIVDGEEDKESISGAAFEDHVDYVTKCHDPAQAGVKTGKFSVICWGDCSTATETCEQLREKFGPVPFSPLEDEIVKSRDEFEEEERAEEREVIEEEEIWEEEEEEDEKIRYPWLDMCKEMYLPIEGEEDTTPGTTDPYISHELYLPYSKMPKPRKFDSVKEKEYIVSTVRKRDRSPIRTVPPGKFDLKDAYKNWQDKHVYSMIARRTLTESKKRVSSSIRELSHEYVDRDVRISSVALQAVCERVTMTLMQSQVDTDIHTFVNIAIIWALSELDLFTPDMLTDEPSDLPKELLNKHHGRESVRFEETGDGGLRRILLGVYRPPFSRDMFSTLHRRLPWQYMGPAHERGHMKLYPNIRERIREKSSGTKLYDACPYTSDVNCIHVRDVSDDSYLAYTRKSKFFSLPVHPSSQGLEDFLQIVSST